MTSSNGPAGPSIALVTGGTRGIGRAVVEALLREGWTVDFCGHTRDSVERAETELRQRLPEHAGRLAGRPCNVRSEAQVESLVAWTLERHREIHLLVNNAGVGAFAPVDEISGDDARRVIETNLLGCFYGIRAVAPIMRKQKRGWIVNLASLAGKNPFAGGAIYNASKFGLIGLSEAAMLDLRHDGVRVASILPGSVDTQFGAGRRGGPSDWMLAPEDVAEVVLDLLRYPDRALPSLVEIRPSKPPKK